LAGAGCPTLSSDFGEGWDYSVRVELSSCLHQKAKSKGRRIPTRHLKIEKCHSDARAQRDRRNLLLAGAGCTTLSPDFGEGWDYSVRVELSSRLHHKAKSKGRRITIGQLRPEFLA
jgi:hypothetical protein